VVGCSVFLAELSLDDVTSRDLVVVVGSIVFLVRILLDAVAVLVLVMVKVIVLERASSVVAAIESGQSQSGIAIKSMSR
jgi:hypothetical protein